MIKINKILNFIFISTVVIFSMQLKSCEEDKINGEVIVDAKLLSKLYSESIDTLLFQSNNYILETELYRDFFPSGGSIPKKRRPLIASIYLVNIDSLPISTDLDIKKLYVINNQQIWIAALSNRVQTDVPNYKLGKLSINGPEWDTNIYVDVVLEIKNILTMEIYFLMARDQYVMRVE